MLGALAIAFAPFGLKSPATKALALSLFTVGFWATGALPEYLTSLAFFALAMLSSVSAPQVVTLVSRSRAGDRLSAKAGDDRNCLLSGGEGDL